MKGLTVTVLSLLAVSTFASGALAQSGGYHVDEQTGYKVRRPAGWQEMPLKVAERWIVAKFLSDKEYFVKESGWGFKPDMRVIVFPLSVTEDRGITKTESEDGEKKVITLEIKNPYKNYKDYLDQNYRGGGWFVSLEEEKEKKGLEWTLMEIKVEKLAYGGKKRIVAGVFHHEDGDFVVQFEVLEKSYAKVKGMVYGCLKSFQFIPRKGTLGRATTGGPDLTDEGKLTPEERKKRRLAKQRAVFERAIEGAPAGWTSFEYKGFFVLCHVDKKYAMKVVKQAEAVRKWLEKTFPYMGDEYVRPPIIRICKDRDEERAFFSGSGDSWLSAGREITTHKDQSAGSASSEFEYVNRRIVSGWFSDKDPDMTAMMPEWLRLGLGQYVGTGRAKGAKMAFKADEWEKQRIREAEKKGEIKPVREMLKMSWDEFSFAHSSQSAALLRFLFDGPGRGMKGAKTFLEDYLVALREIAAEKAKEAERESGEAKEGPKTEEEEEEEYKNRRKKWKDAEKKTLQEVLDRAFSDWKDSTWQKLERSFSKFIS